MRKFGGLRSLGGAIGAVVGSPGPVFRSTAIGGHLRENVEGDRPMLGAIAVSDEPDNRPRLISSRSASCRRLGPGSQRCGRGITVEADTGDYAQL